MADKILHKRSYTPGSKPTTSNLDALGEIAINVNDGKAFLRKSGSGIDTIEEFVITNAINTGSITLSGSLNLTGSFLVTGSTTQIGNNNLLGNTTLSGSIIISGAFGTNNPTVKIYGDTEHDGYIRFDPVSTNINQSLSASYIYVSGSTNDLYFTQNGQGYANTTRLRWLEGNLYTGLLHGGLITIQTGSTWFNLSSGSGIVVDLNASLSDNPYPTITYVNWGNFTSQSLTYLTSSIQTYIAINSSGQIVQHDTPLVDGEFNTQILIGTVLHQNKTTVNASITYPGVAYGYKQRTYDFIKAFGPLKLSGLTIIPSSSLGLNVGSGTAYADGRNYQLDPNNPSYITDSGTTVSKIFRYYQSGSSFVQDTSGGLGYTVIDPANYNPDGTGVLTAVPGTGINREWSIQRVFWYPNSATKGIVVYYGTSTYASEIDAAANISYEQFQEVENTKQNAVYLGAIVIRNNGNFTDPTSYKILPGGIFRNVGGSGGGGNISSLLLSQLGDVVLSGPTDGQPLAYINSTTKWENKSYISASISGNAATATTSATASSADTFIIRNGATISGSVVITGSINASSITSSFTGSLTGSLFGTASWATNALTASSADNLLIRNGATISGSINQSGSFTINGTLTATTLVVQTITASVEFLTGSTKFGDATNDTHQFTGSVGISGSLTVVGPTIASGSFTGSFLGNYSGSYTGSYTGSLTGSLLGTASWAASASQAVTASFIASTGTNAFVQNGNSFGTAAILGTNEAQNLQFETNNAIRVTISGSNGNVGINTTTPLSTLDVNGMIIGGTSSSVDGAAILVGKYSPNLGHLTTFGSNQSSGGPVIGYNIYPSSSINHFISSITSSIFIARSAFAADSTFRWYTGPVQAVNVGASASLSQKMILDNDGNLGIGVTTPTVRLHVSGNIVATGSLQITGSTSLTGSLGVLGAVSASSFTGSFFGTYSGSYTGSYTGSLTGILIGTSSWATNALTASSADSFIIRNGVTITGSINTSGSFTTIGNKTITGSLLVSGSTSLTGSLGVLGAISASSFTGSFFGTYTGSFTGSFTGSLTGSLFGTSSWALSASQAITASYVASIGTNAFVQNGNSFGTSALLGTNDNFPLGIETNGSTRLFISGSGIIDYSIQYLGATSASNATTITLPASGSSPNNGGLLEGDLVIVTSIHGNVSASIPTGYTSSVNAFTSSMGYMWAYKFMGSTPDTTATNITGSTLAFAFRNVNRNSPFNVSGSTSGSTGMPDPPSITTTANGAMVVALGFLDRDANFVVTAPPSYTLIGYTGSVVAANSGSIMAAYLQQSVSGTADPGIFTGSGTDLYVASTFALTPITSSGNIGINNTTPLTTLHIGTPVSADFNLTNKAPVRISTPSFNTSASINEALFIDHYGQGDFTSGSGTAIVMGYKNPLYGSYTSRIVNYTNTNISTATRLQLQTQKAGSNNTWNEGILINESGFIGIANTSPSSYLHVKEVLNTGNEGFLITNFNNIITTRIGSDSATGGGKLSLRTNGDVTTVFLSSYTNSYFNGGNVGVGTTTPSSSLHVANTNAQGIIVGTTTGSIGTLQLVGGASSSPVGNRIMFGTDDTGWQFRIAKNRTGSITDLITIQDNGSVGIGTIIPSARLHVTSSTGTIFKVDGNGVANTDAINVSSSGRVTIDDTYRFESGILDFGSGYANGVITWDTAGGDNNYAAFYSKPPYNLRLGTTTYTSAVFVTASNGNVGIGTTTPRDVLDIFGSVIIRNTYNLSWGNTYGAGVPTITGTSGSNAFMAFYPAGSTSGEKVRIDNTGSIGIGTTAPAAKLDVQGTIFSGNNGATEGSIILQDQYSIGHATNFGTNRSSGGPFIGYAVTPSTTTTNQFFSSITGSIAFPRSAFIVDTTFRWYTGTSQAVIVGASASLSEKMILDNDGNLGVGTVPGTTRVYRLEVYSSGSGGAGGREDKHIAAIGSAPSLNLITSESSARHAGTIGMATTSNNFFTGTTGGELCIINRGVVSGSILFGHGGTINASLSTAGTLTVRGDVIAYGTPSDISYKTNISPISNSLDKIMSLEPVSFTWKEDTETSKLTDIKDDIGFIAQQVQEVLPELVRQNTDDKLSIRERAIIPLLVGAIKEQQKQIDELKYLLQNKQ